MTGVIHLNNNIFIYMCVCVCVQIYLKGQAIVVSTQRQKDGNINYYAIS